MSAAEDEWWRRWRRYEDSPFEARLAGSHDGPIDLTTGTHQVEVAHTSGRMEYFSIEGERDVPVVYVNLVEADETFLDRRLLKSITTLLSLSTMSVIKWDGYVE